MSAANCIASFIDEFAGRSGGWEPVVMLRPKGEVTERPDGALVERWAKPTATTDRYRDIARVMILVSEVAADHRIVLSGEGEDFKDSCAWQRGSGAA